MKYLELIKESNEELKERYELVAERVAELAKDASDAGVYADYFEKTAQFLVLLNTIVEGAKGKEINEKLYADILGDAYATSYANPTYAVEKFGVEAGQILTALHARIRACRLSVFEGNLQNICILSELFVELYSYFCEENVELSLVKDALYSFMHDYTEVFNEDAILRIMNPDYDYYMDIVMDSDLSDASYLYNYGLYVGHNETGISEFLNTFSDEEMQAMADTYTEGYRMGFVAMQKDLSIKTTVEIRYPIGFERMV